MNETIYAVAPCNTNWWPLLPKLREALTRLGAELAKVFGLTRRGLQVLEIKLVGRYADPDKIRRMLSNNGLRPIDFFEEPGETSGSFSF